MQITLNLKGYGETKLSVLPLDDKNKGTETAPKDFVLVFCEDDIENPFMRLQLTEENKFKILNQREVEETDDDLIDKLNDLAIRVVEAIQLGIDLSAISLSKRALEKPYNPDQIRVESKTFSIRLIYDMIKDGDLDLSPDFQRNVVWDSYRKSRLIESILLRIPLPMFYFSQDEEGKLFVVDGLQRLTAIKEFMDNKLVLRDLEYLSGTCEGKTYNKENNKIEEKYYRWFNMTQLSVNVIDPQSPSKVKYDIFRRLNTGGRPLNAQELRNCLAKERVRKALREMAGLSSFKKATGNSISDTRMDAQELALRFIFFRFHYKKGAVKKYTGNMDLDLDDFVDLLNKMGDFEFDKYVAEFDSAMKIARYLFGRHAFRKVYINTVKDSPKSLVNKALFVSWSVLLADYDYNKVKNSLDNYCFISILGERISSDDEYYRALSYGTNGRKNILIAFEVAEQIIKANITK